MGIGGPVGSGKTQLVEALLPLAAAARLQVAVITNDLVTLEDAQRVQRSGLIDPALVVGVETGACPHTAIREDPSMNQAAAARLEAEHGPLDLLLLESGGDNLAATFSPELVDYWIYVIDTAAGDDIPRKGGLGVIQADLLVVNKIDLALHVGADLDRMREDVAVARPAAPVPVHQPSRPGRGRRGLHGAMSLGTVPRRAPVIALPATRGVLELVADVAPDGRTYLSRRRQRFPLRLTVPLYLDPGCPQMAFLYVQNPTGGMFADDDLQLSLRARSGACAHLTTQAATKIYAAREGCARNQVELAVERSAFVEYVPDVLIPHAGARLEQELVADVDPGGTLIATELIAPGRVAHDEAFEYASLSLTTRVRVDGREVAVDSLVLSPGRCDPRGPGILGRHRYLGSLFVVAPDEDAGGARGRRFRRARERTGLHRGDGHAAFRSRCADPGAGRFADRGGASAARSVGRGPPRAARDASAAESQVTVLVQELLGDAGEARFEGRRRDPLALTSEDARRRRLRLVTASGTAVAVDLPRGSFIPHDAVLHDDGERIVVAVRAPELALVVRLDASLPGAVQVGQAVLVGHWAGNQHLLVETARHEVRVRIAATPALMLDAARALELPGADIHVAEIPFARDRAPAVAGHAHG